MGTDNGRRALPLYLLVVYRQEYGVFLALSCALCLLALILGFGFGFGAGSWVYCTSSGQRGEGDPRQHQTDLRFG